MGGARTIFYLLIGVILFAGSASAPAQISESEVKAAFLPRFARYVTWPASARPNGNDPYVLCVIGSDPFGGALDSAARSQSVDGRRIVVRHLDGASGASACQIAYVSGNTIGQTLAALKGRPVLTVTDASNGGLRGIIHFSVVGGRVRFFIDEADAASRGMTISSRLLALAISVRQR